MKPLWYDAIQAELDDYRLCDCEPMGQRLVRFMIDDRLGAAIHLNKLEQRGTTNSNYWEDCDYWEEADETIPFFSDGE